MPEKDRILSVCNYQAYASPPSIALASTSIATAIPAISARLNADFVLLASVKSPLQEPLRQN